MPAAVTPAASFPKQSYDTSVTNIGSVFTSLLHPPAPAHYLYLLHAQRK